MDEADGRREHIYFLIDDTRIEKRGKKMECISKTYDHKTRRFIRSHMVVTGALMFRSVVVTWHFDLWIPQEVAGVGYRKTTHIAAQMINALELPWDLKVRVLFDAYYLAPCDVKACETPGFSWFSVASKNRKMKRKHCQKRSIKEFAAGSYVITVGACAFVVFVHGDG